MYSVIEMQTNETLEIEALSFETRSEADAHFYTVLAKASTSEAIIHSAVMLTSEGYFIKSECFNRTPVDEVIGEEVINANTRAR